MMRRQASGVTLAVVLLILTAVPNAALGVTICDVQAYDEDWGSPLEGQTVTIQGVVTIPPGVFQPDYSSFYIEADGCGVNVFDYDPPPMELSVGDTIEVTGVVTEFNGNTEVVYSTLSLLSQGTTEIEPTYIPLNELPKEENEGRFLETIGVVTSENQYSFYIEQPWTGVEVQVYQSNPDLNVGMFAVGDTVDISGILVQYDQDPPYTEGWELSPRYDSDMKYAVPPPPPEPEFWTNSALRIPSQVFRPGLDEIIPIAYLAPDRSAVKMQIYDLQGRVVRTLTDAEYVGYSTLPEFYKADFFVEGTRGWDGRDDLRRLVHAGAYVCRLEVEDRDGNVSVSTAPIVVGFEMGE
jgi:hypothetical protein